MAPFRGLPRPIGYNDAQIFPLFYWWPESSIAEADEVCVDASYVRNMLEQPYRGRLDALINAVVLMRNSIDADLHGLAQGLWTARTAHEAREHTRDAGSVRTSRTRTIPNNARSRLHKLDRTTEILKNVVAAWRAVLLANVFELLAKIGQSEVNRARNLQREIRSLETKLRDLQKIIQGKELAEAWAQLGINTAITAITASLALLTGISAPVNLAITIASTVVQLSVDELLGPDRLDWWPDAVSGGASVIGASIPVLEKAAPELLENATKLKQVGKALGRWGTRVGVADDLNEVRHAAQKIPEAERELESIASRLEVLSRELKSLLPILQFPEVVEAILRGLRREARILRNHGQIILRKNRQM